MKSDKQTYKAKSPPAYQADVGLVGQAQEPRRKNPGETSHSQSIEYDDRIRQEKKRYSRLLTELRKAQEFAYLSVVLDGFSQFDVGEPPGTECDVGRIIDEATLSDMETTRLTDAQIRHDCELTMEQMLSKRNKPPDWDVGKHLQMSGERYREVCKSINSPPERDVSISWMKGQIHNADIMALGSDDMKQDNLYELRLEVDEAYSDIWLRIGSSCDPPWRYALECVLFTVVDSTGPPFSRMYGNWGYSYGWPHYIWPIPWDSIVVESVRLILQRWSRVYSFSLTTCCTWQVGEREIVYRLHTGENKST